MKTIQLSLTIMAAVLLLTGCAKESYMESDSEIVRISASVASSFDEVMTKSSEETGRQINLVSEDEKISIPMALSTAPGIDGISMAEETPITKGALINDNDKGDLSNIDLPSSISSFKVAAWTGTSTTASIPAYTDVTYANGKWSTSTTYTWKKGDEKTFVAYANLPSSGATITSEAAGTQKLTYTVPDAASAQKDILMGYYKGTGNDSGTAAITFYHPLTAVKFVVGDMLDVTAITKISLKGVYASGNTTQSADGTSFSWEGTTSTMTVSQDITGNLPSKGSQVGEAFLLIPQNLTDANIKVTINAIINGTPAELIATLSSGDWKAGYTNIYTLGYKYYYYTTSNDGGETVQKIEFAGGNLYCISYNKNGGGSGYTFLFENNQWENRGTGMYSPKYHGMKVEGDHALVVTSDGKIKTTTPYQTSGLFNWNKWDTCDGVYGENASYGAFDFNDFGELNGETTDRVEFGDAFNISNGTTGWRTLSGAEWEYTILHRTVEAGDDYRCLWTYVDTGYVYADDEDNAGEKAYMNGVLLFPDNWDETDPEFTDGDPVPEHCVFLPAAGLRKRPGYYGYGVMEEWGEKGLYWGVDAKRVNSAHGPDFTPGGCWEDSDERAYGLSVRLVKNIGGTYPGPKSE